MSTIQDDRGVEPEDENIPLTDDAASEEKRLPHVLDALGNPAAIEDDLAGD
ncbi:hypothetical protein K8R03_00850 [Candidatus Kaiserbacteria bacterium]|nr:hypothetical protein [Candidatus Kaiserbacteria bacterium]